MTKKPQPEPEVEGRARSMVRQNKRGQILVRLQSFVPVAAVDELDEFERDDPRPRGIILGEAIKHYVRAQRRRSGT